MDDVVLVDNQRNIFNRLAEEGSWVVVLCPDERKLHCVGRCPVSTVIFEDYTELVCSSVSSCQIVHLKGQFEPVSSLVLDDHTVTRKVVSEFKPDVVVLNIRGLLRNELPI